jgi:hypothetical protein
MFAGPAVGDTAQECDMQYKVDPGEKDLEQKELKSSSTVSMMVVWHLPAAELYTS